MSVLMGHNQSKWKAMQVNRDYVVSHTTLFFSHSHTVIHTHLHRQLTGELGLLTGCYFYFSLISHYVQAEKG